MHGEKRWVHSLSNLPIGVVRGKIQLARIPEEASKANAKGVGRWGTRHFF
jgi:hypothetical protein